MWNKRKRLGSLFIVSGSSGSGKTTLLLKVRQKREFPRNIMKIITVTTRAARNAEKNGRDYYFVDREEFSRRRKRGEFAEFQEIYGDYYATPKRDLLRVLAAGNDALLCVDVKGALNLKRIFPKNAVLIFIAVPDLKSLKERLACRSSETRESLRKRLRIVKDEIQCAARYDYVIINDILSQAVKKLSAIITAERLRAGNRQAGSLLNSKKG
jgi:guanylate kinase